MKWYILALVLALALAQEDQECYKEGKDYSGGDLGSFHTPNKSIKECLEACTRHPECWVGSLFNIYISWYYPRSTRVKCKTIISTNIRWKMTIQIVHLSATSTKRNYQMKKQKVEVYLFINLFITNVPVMCLFQALIPTGLYLGEHYLDAGGLSVHINFR